MTLSALTKPNFPLQVGDPTYKNNIDAIVSEIADEPETLSFVTQPPLFNAEFKDSLAFDGTGFIDFTRASTATYLDRYGVLRYALIDEPRFEKNGFLIEGGSENLLTRSEEFDHADWTKENSYVATADVGLAPDGTLTADRGVYPTASLARTYEDTSGLANKTVTWSVWLKSNTGSDQSDIRMYLRETGFGTTYGTLFFTVTSEWQRFSLTATIPGGSVSVLNLIYHASSSAAEWDLLQWGAQLEELPFASSYIPTVASTVTRSDDVCTLTFDGNVPAIDEDISVICDVDILGFNTDSQAILGDDNVLFFDFRAALTGGLIHASLRGGPSTFISGLAVNQISRIGVVSNATVSKGFVDGVLDKSLTPVAVSGAHDKIYIGSRTLTTEFLFGHLSNLRIYDIAFTGVVLIVQRMPSTLVCTLLLVPDPATAANKPI